MKKYSGVCFFSILLLGGCASYQTVPFNNTANTDVHALGLVTVDTPPGLTVTVRTAAASNFGLIGGLIEQGVVDKKSKEFTKSADSMGYSLNTELTNDLVTDLSAEGYKVNTVKAVRMPDAFLNQYPKANGDDAFLDVVVHQHEAGYRASGDSTKYYPYLFVTARLVSASSHKVLYSEQIIYNPINPPDNARTISPDQKYGYTDFDHLMADPKQSVAGLKEAVAEVAQAVAVDLKQ